jgi:uncharacterized protein involved in exopolysaccharide biosynthesis
MSQDKEEYYSLADILYFIRLLGRFLTRKWWILLFGAAVGVLLGALYFNYFQKPKYEAVCTFILEEKQTGLAGLNGLASQIGLDMGGTGGAGSLFAGDNILDILKSKTIIENVLLTKADSVDGIHQTLADRFLAFSNWKQNWASKEGLKNISFSNYKAKQSLTLTQDSVLNLIYESLLKNSLSTDRLNKKGSIIKVMITAADPVFAKLMSERIIEESKTFYITIKTNTAQQNVNRLERKSDSLLALLNNKSYEAANAVVLDANPAFRNLAVPSELKMRDKSILGSLYAEMIKNLELSRVSLSQQTPLIQILDKPTLPLVNQKKSFLVLTLSFALGGLCIAFGFLCLSFLFKSTSKGTINQVGVSFINQSPTIIKS